MLEGGECLEKKVEQGHGAVTRKARKDVQRPEGKSWSWGGRVVEGTEQGRVVRHGVKALEVADIDQVGPSGL